MNFFKPAYCLDLKDENLIDIDPEKLSGVKKGPIVILENITAPNVFLFFSITKKESQLVKQVMSGSMDIKALSIYNTMIDSWVGSGNFLSGIIMDLNYDKGEEDPKITVNLALSDTDGNIMSLVPVSFYDSIIISCLLRKEYMIGVRLLAHLFPNDSNAQESHSHPFPEDEGLKDIVKDILDGKVKDKDDDSEDKEEK
jgi:hypothetical protein